MPEQPDIFLPGQTCWHRDIAPRVGFLVDTAAYFRAFVAAASRAEKSLYIAGWDFDSRVALIRDAGRTVTFGAFLNDLAAARPGLRIHVLAWDFAMLYALEREWPLFNLSWKRHRRVDYVLDDAHPLGASQHQKFVVVDDRLAFAGGIDLTRNRWDTPGHEPDDGRRTTPDGTAYGPFHDVQMAVDGPMAAHLGELFRQRWRWATECALKRPAGVASDPWPEDLPVDMRQAPVALSRTFPPYKDRPEFREVEAMLLAVIGAAERSLYIENQYFTSRRLARALAARLREADGPEVVLVLPAASSGWLEQATMDAIRRRVLAELVAADTHHRLAILTPMAVDGSPIYVHSKLMIADDRLAVVGTANLTNRSMGLDSELALSVAATGRETDNGVAGLREKLLAEHLGREPDAVAARLRATGSLLAAIKDLGGDGRCLAPLDINHEPPIDALALVEDETLIDPEEPAALDRTIDIFAHEAPHSRRRTLLLVLGALVLLLALAAAWRFTPLSEFIDAERLAAFGRGLRGDPLALVVVPAIFVLAGLAMIPVVALIGATAILFDPLWAIILAMAGCLASASAGYGLGALLGRRNIRRLAGRRLNRLSRHLARRGILAVAVLRNIPVAPYTVANLVAGASHLKFTDYFLGTALGILPGVALITLFADRLQRLIRTPDFVNITVTLVVLGLVVAGAVWLGRRLARYGGSS